MVIKYQLFFKCFSAREPRYNHTCICVVKLIRGVLFVWRKVAYVALYVFRNK